MGHSLSREELMKQADLETRFSGLAVKFWFDLERKDITFVLPFDNEGGSISENIRFAAKVERPVLIHGSTGTGKELASRAIHGLSCRYTRPCETYCVIL